MNKRPFVVIAVAVILILAAAAAVRSFFWKPSDRSEVRVIPEGE